MPDLVALMLGSDARVRTDDDLVFFNNPRSLDGAVWHLGQRQIPGLDSDAMAIRPAAIDQTIHRIVFGCAGGGLDSPTGVELSLEVLDINGAVMGGAALRTKPSPGGALILFEVYRRDGTWRCRLLDQSYAGGLAEFVADFGVVVDAGPPPPEPVAPVAPAVSAPSAIPPPPPGLPPWPALPAAQQTAPPGMPRPASPAAPIGPPVPPRPARSMFTSRRRAQLEVENAAMRHAMAAAGGFDNASMAAQRDGLAREIGALAGEADRKRAEIAALDHRLAQARAELVQSETDMALQDVGIYEYRHRLDNAPAYRLRLDALRSQIKSLASSGRAVGATTTWTVNNSAAQGARMVREFSKLMLRAYNADVDQAVRALRPTTLGAALNKIDKSRATIARLGQTMQIHITDTYHQLRWDELQLTADYLQKVEDEREQQRATRERQREEQRAAAESEREQTRLKFEQQQYADSIRRLLERGDSAGATELQAKLDAVARAINLLEERQANYRIGHVYVISNVGAFGEHMVKIGMTRRLDPMDRVRELGDASVPFRFDVHALIFSDDAVGLETRLHQHFADTRVNLVNRQREFFYTTPAEVRDVLQELAGEHLVEYVEVAEAPEWRQSGGPERASALIR